MGAMSEVTAASPRRSSRVFHKMRVEVQGRAHNRKKFKETCETVVVNGHGGLLMLKHEVDNGEMLVITNPETQEEQECRIVYLGDPSDKGQRVGIEFYQPIVMNDAENGGGVNGAMKLLPALAAQAANPARSGSNRQRDEQHESRKADGNVTALGHVFPHGREIEG